MIEVNGKQYPFWSQFVEGKEKWIGGILEDFGDSMDRRMLGEDAHFITEITDIILAPNGTESAMFLVNGKGFSCGFDVGVGGVTAGEEGWITLSGYGDHTWRIKKRVVAPPVDLGYANGWGRGNTPEIVKICEDMKHLGYSKNVGKCLTEYGCEICNYHYLVDSSD